MFVGGYSVRGRCGFGWQELLGEGVSRIVLGGVRKKGQGRGSG